MPARRKFSATMLLFGAGLAPAAAFADIPPAPGESERALAAIVDAAGFKCGAVATYADIEGAAAEPYHARRLEAVYRVVCANGARYIVALPHAVLRARPPLLDSSGKPIPNPPPEVKPVSQ